MRRAGGRPNRGQLRRCEIDLLGTAETERRLGPRDDRRARIPTMAEALKLAKRSGVEVNLEIKNIPGDNDFDSSNPPAYATRIAAQIKRTGFPPGRLIVQSFYPPNLGVIEDDPYFDEARTSFLDPRGTQRGGARDRRRPGLRVVSPEWPVDAAYVANAHAPDCRSPPSPSTGRARSRRPRDSASTR